MDRNMFKKLMTLFIFSTLPLVSIAEELVITEDAPKEYVVVKGDTLWDISTIFLDQPWLWPQLWRLNPDISNPHLIYPGDVLKLVYDEQGKPMLVIEEPEVIEKVIAEPEKVVVIKEKPSFNWGPKIRKSAKPEPINTLPLEVIAPYIRYDNMFTEAQLENLPYVIGSDDGYKSSMTDFKVYIKGDLPVAKTYAIYTKGSAIIDPETEESLGYSMKLVGTGQILKTGDIASKIPSTMTVNSATQEIRAGSYVVPINDGQLYPAYFTMQAADKSVKGSIINASSQGREFGKLEVVMINRGKVHKVKQGDVLSINRKSPSVVDTVDGPMNSIDASHWNRLGKSNNFDYDMPVETIGKMMVFKVYEKTSMALILKTNKPARLNDSVIAPK
jgi:hypothetical protein